MLIPSKGIVIVEAKLPAYVECKVGARAPRSHTASGQESAPSGASYTFRMLPADWIEHRRDDGERVGWIVPHGDAFLAYDILGRLAAAESIDWMAAEEALETRGIGFLAGRHQLQLPDGTERPVRISEVNTTRIVVIADEWGSASAVGSNADIFELPFPAPEALRVE